jgi:hypothetical protein
MNAEELAGAAGVVLSLLLSYVPGLNARFDALSPTGKRLVVLALLVAVAGGAFALGCWLPTPHPLPLSPEGARGVFECSQVGAWGLARVLAAAVITNQAAFLLSPRRGGQASESAAARVAAAPPNGQKSESAGRRTLAARGPEPRYSPARGWVFRDGRTYWCGARITVSAIPVRDSSARKRRKHARMPGTALRR